MHGETIPDGLSGPALGEDVPGRGYVYMEGIPQRGGYTYAAQDPYGFGLASGDTAEPPPQSKAPPRRQPLGDSSGKINVLFDRPVKLGWVLAGLAAIGGGCWWWCSQRAKQR